MVSLRLRTRTSLIEEMRGRTRKIPTILDDEDFNRQVTKAVGSLDERLAIPRVALLTNARNGVLDVTPFDIDEINTVYYSPGTAESLLGGMDLGVGLLPIITGGSNLTNSLGSLIDYMTLKSVFNMIQRQMMNTEDYYLMPTTADGRQLLQVRNQGSLFALHYLPYLKPDDPAGWGLYEPEWQFLQDLTFYRLLEANAEFQLNASLLGTSKEAMALVEFYVNKQKDLIQAFEDAALIEYLA